MPSIATVDQLLAAIKAGGTYDIAPGVYRLSSPRTLRRTVKLRAAGPGVVVSGGIEVGNWSDAGNGVLMAEVDLSEVETVRVGRKLYRQARLPKPSTDDPGRSGWFGIGGSRPGSDYDQPDTTEFLPEDRDIGIERGMYAHIWAAVNWKDTRAEIVSVDRDGWLRASPSITYNCGPDGYKRVGRFYLYNSRRFLTEPGEFFFDARKRRLYLIPDSEGEFARLGHATVPATDYLLKITAPGCEIGGIAFRDAYDRYFQAAVMVEGDETLIEACDFQGVTTAVSMLECRSSIVRGCSVRDTFAAAIVVDGPNLVEGCYVARTSTRFRWKGGVSAGNGATVRHCRIEDSPRSAMTFGREDILIEFNELLWSNRESADSGALYAENQRQFNNRNIRIRHNHIHDTGGLERFLGGKYKGPPHSSWAIYLDEYTSGVEVYGNISDVTGHGFVFQHKGGRNIIRNNISARSNFVHVRCKHELGHPAETLVELNAGDPAGDRMYEISGDEPTIRDNCSLSAGMRPTDIEADPKILRDGGGRITGLAPDSPLFARGFSPIPVERIGLRGSPHGWAGRVD